MQPHVVLDDGQGPRTIYTLPEAFSDRDSVLFFTVPKSGTVMMSTIIGNLAWRVGLHLVYLVGEFFNQGVDWKKAPPSTSSIFLPKGYCYGFPLLPTEFEIPLIGKAKTIILVRDPRDMLVSLYYSMKFSHPEPGKNLDLMPERNLARSLEIDEFVNKIFEMDNSYSGDGALRKYMELARDGFAKVFRYEDVIYDKERWVSDICDYFDWEIDDEIKKDVAAKVNVFPDSEHPDSHVRQVHPGNYKTKLKPETISKIEQMCEEEMAFFGYSSLPQHFLP